MWHLIILRAIRNYVPIITLPFAAVIGAIGYNLENILSGKVRIIKSYETII